ncbi:NAD(P)/FAD-dependent oxidoreductase [Nannocystis sp. SCPEA4]|uniref:flavin-containing monooxygenase n=1 Tax=Nannocystis sp. SCPEA4 TaxID=2996787 RepID=UPI00226F7D51|nr:NAD(P)/FAD-dependent oxidoreductase [Nannocystis sp. SCPEA4]MCY1060104.1 NAD(P)/FAD-dependent oxidoreductase [Nannocystis sp. SCPEA4]
MTVEHLDVLIIGAGLSGVGAAYHLQHGCPGKSFALLEARADLGGTWDLFRYPGVRSDSDMHTLGYSFRPWTEARAIADGPSILRYLRDTAVAYGIDRKIRFHHRVLTARYSSVDARWTVEVVRSDTGEELQLTCDFLLGCTGYYRYDEGYTPRFAGTERFSGRIVHPQHWPADLDYAGKRVVVIGSGATAVTLIPAMAATAAHVTMLQRSPTWISSLPTDDPVAGVLRRWLPEGAAAAAVRWKNILFQLGIYQTSRRRPDMIKRLLRRALERQLPSGYDIERHFTPRYDPWDQRLCLAPDGDFFKAIRRGQASVVTDEIETFTETGLRLKSGDELAADIIVTATGLNLLLFGGIRMLVDAEEVQVSARKTYKGLMLEGVPNFAFALGYTNASWTLKADLTGEYVCRLLKHMDARGHRQCVPINDDSSMTERPLLDFGAGYVLRSLAMLPKQGSRAPWRLRMNYPSDLVSLRLGSVTDKAMRFA